ncbi:type I glutamate--ammonia ligase, partial [Streptomyces sp. SID11233]|nr:type I glutamate--ammonia ligase [Streptomyces sp. SID11233]
APEEHAGVPQVPTSLPAVLDALEADNEYLQAGGVFTSDLIETWIDYKRTAEIAPIQLRPHPHEFELYFDI